VSTKYGGSSSSPFGPFSGRLKIWRFPLRWKTFVHFCSFLQMEILIWYFMVSRSRQMKRRHTYGINPPAAESHSCPRWSRLSIIDQSPCVNDELSIPRGFEALSNQAWQSPEYSFAHLLHTGMKILSSESTEKLWWTEAHSLSAHCSPTR